MSTDLDLATSRVLAALDRLDQARDLHDVLIATYAAKLASAHLGLALDLANVIVGTTVRRRLRRSWPRELREAARLLGECGKIRGHDARLTLH